MRLKKILISTIFAMSLISLSSCNINKFNLEKDDIIINPDEPSNPEEPEDTPPTPDPYDPNSETNYIINRVPLNYTEFWGYNDLNRYENKDNLKKLYKDILDSYETFYLSKIDLEETKVNNNNIEKSYYIIDSVNYKKYNLTSNQAIAVWRLVNLDNPKYFFIDNNVLTDGNNIKLVCSNLFNTSESRTIAKTNIKEYIDKFKNELNEELTNKEIIKIIHDYICNNASYSFKEDGTPDDSFYTHNILGIMTLNKGVCESYSETFKYLCNLLNINCVTAEGIGKTKKGDEEHAWNVVNINDSWYFLDVTWNDSTNSYKYYCKSYQEMIKDHIPNNSESLSDGINYIYNLPEISDSSLEQNQIITSEKK